MLVKLLKVRKFWKQVTDTPSWLNCYDTFFSKIYSCIVHILGKPYLFNLVYFFSQVTTRARVILNRPQSSAPVPLFIIIAAILVGLLLFILLTLLLWKFGFFKRRRLDPTLSGNLEKHRIDDNWMWCVSRLQL